MDFKDMEIFKELDLDKNIDIDKLTTQNNQKVWWKCKKGHSYQLSIKTRIYYNGNCPYCKHNGKEKLHKEYPQLVKYIVEDTEENLHSWNKIIKFKCELGHEWEDRINNQIKLENHCPICDNRKFLQGFNDLESKYPKIAKQLISANPKEISYMSRKKEEWECEYGHKWKMSVYLRTAKGFGCTVCSGRSIQSGVNDLATLKPEILKEWDYDKNIYNPNEISIRSGKKVWWKCELNHSYMQTVDKKTSRTGKCPYCINKRVLTGFNDLASMFPKLIQEEWDNSNILNPQKILPHVNKKAKWHCNKCGKIYEAKIYNKTNSKPTGCPYCNNKIIEKGFNDLATKLPLIKNIWDFDKNDLDLYTLSLWSNRKAWFKCEKNHSWHTKISHISESLLKEHIPCPKCNNQTSFGEQAIYYYLKEIGAKNRYKYNGKEIDIYLENLNIGIEFNGEFWHRNKLDKDLEKEIYLSQFMKMFYVLEDHENKIIGNKVYFNTKNYNINLEWAIKELFKLLGFDIEVDINKDKKFINKFFI